MKNVSKYIDHNSQEYKKMVEWIAKELEVTTLRYQTVDDMVKAIGLPKEKLCLYCWTGEYPKPMAGKGKKKEKNPAVKKRAEAKRKV
ncbi:Amidophosphoribosyltransferase [subsurface metagenome]